MGYQKPSVFIFFTLIELEAGEARVRRRKKEE